MNFKRTFIFTGTEVFHIVPFQCLIARERAHSISIRGVFIFIDDAITHNTPLSCRQSEKKEEKEGLGKILNFGEEY